MIEQKEKNVKEMKKEDLTNKMEKIYNIWHKYDAQCTVTWKIPL